MVDNTKTASLKVALIATMMLAVVSLGISLFNNVNGPQIAFVDSAVLLEQYPPAIQAREDLDVRTQEWRANISVLEGELDSLRSVLSEGQLSSSDRRQLLASFEAKQVEFSRYARAIADRTVEVETELFEPVLSRIDRQMREYGDARGYSLILGTGSGGVILHGEDANDATQDFLDFAGAGR